MPEFENFHSKLLPHIPKNNIMPAEYLMRFESFINNVVYE